MFLDRGHSGETGVPKQKPVRKKAAKKVAKRPKVKAAIVVDASAKLEKLAPSAQSLGTDATPALEARVRLNVDHTNGS